MPTWKLLNTETAWHWLVVDSETGVVVVGENKILFDARKDFINYIPYNNNVLFDFTREKMIVGILTKNIKFTRILNNNMIETTKSKKIVEFITRFINSRFNKINNRIKFSFIKKMVLSKKKKEQKVVIFNKEVI